MSVVAIVYFSGYGHTAKQAEAVADGVRSAGATARVYRLTDQGDLPDATTLEDVGHANAIIYGSPTYMGGPAWQFKKFADACSSIFRSQTWKNKIAAGFTNSAAVSGDKFATVSYFWTLAMQLGQIWVGTGITGRHKKRHASRRQLVLWFCRRSRNLAGRRFGRRGSAQRRSRDRQAVR
jgi:NAD(P)H dehydrogenase (quinone)